jgi:hypothetical protein
LIDKRLKFSDPFVVALTDHLEENLEDIVELENGSTEFEFIIE